MALCQFLDSSWSSASVQWPGSPAASAAAAAVHAASAASEPSVWRLPAAADSSTHSQEHPGLWMKDAEAGSGYKGTLCFPLHLQKSVAVAAAAADQD